MFEALYQYVFHQAETGGIPLKGTGIIVAVALIVLHLIAIIKPEQTKSFLQQFPRHYGWGVVLTVIAFLWSMVCLNFMHMGEFFFLRPWFLVLVPVGVLLVLIYVQEFLSVRALGSCLLLIAGIVLQAAFQRPQASRLLLPILAYAWIFAGLYFVGMPYLMRDGVEWITKTANRWRLAAWAGLGYGTLLLIVALVDY
jgi:hypothetical protein